MTRWLRRVPSLPARVLRARVPARLRRAVLVPLAFLAVGTVGYPAVEGRPWTWFDGLYMTAITLTTLGYGEVHPLSPAGRAFTIVLAFGGIFVLFYFATETVRTVVTGELAELLGRERMAHDLTTLAGHLIVCGFGRMGRIVCDELDRSGKRFVAIDTAPAPVAAWPYKHGLRVQGDATEDEVLRAARVDAAAAVITVVGSDAANLYITLSARLLNPGLLIVARAEEAAAEVKLRKVGADRVVFPYLAGGHQAVLAAVRPSVLQFTELAARAEFRDVLLEEVQVAAGSRLAGQTVGGSRLHDQHGVLVVGIRHADGPMQHNPLGDAPIPAGCTLLVLGRRGPLDAVTELAEVTAG